MIWYFPKIVFFVDLNLEDESFWTCVIKMGTSPYSEGPLIRRFYCPKTYISKVLYSEGSIVRKVFGPKIQ